MIGDVNIKKQLGKVLFMLLCFTMPDVLISQNSKIDSLYKILNIETKDTVKLNILNSIAGEWGKINLDSGIAVGKKIVELAERIGINEKTADAYYLYGMGYFLKGDYPGALKQHFKCLHMAEKAKMVKLEGRVLVTIGNAFMMQARSEEHTSELQSQR